MTNACKLQDTCNISMTTRLIDRYFTLPLEKQNFLTLRIALVNVCRNKHTESANIAKKLIDKASLSKEKKDRTEMLELLRFVDEDTGNTCLMFACGFGNLELLETLWAALIYCCDQA
jgi:hypothetical protein